MDELSKIDRNQPRAAEFFEGNIISPDATTGQNAITQAKEL